MALPWAPATATWKPPAFNNGFQSQADMDSWKAAISAPVSSARDTGVLAPEHGAGSAGANYDAVAAANAKAAGDWGVSKGIYQYPKKGSAFHEFTSFAGDTLKQIATNPVFLSAVGGGIAAGGFGAGAATAGAGAGTSGLTAAEQASILGTGAADFGVSGGGGVLGAAPGSLSASEGAAIAGGGAAADFGVSGGGGVLGAPAAAGTGATGAFGATALADTATGVGATATGAAATDFGASGANGVLGAAPGALPPSVVGTAGALPSGMGPLGDAATGVGDTASKTYDYDAINKALTAGGKSTIASSLAPVASFAAKYGLPIAALGTQLLRKPGIPQEGNLNKQYNTQEAQGQADLASAREGKISQSQQAQIDRFKSDSMSSLKQYMANSGQGVDSTSFLEMKGKVDQTAIAMQQGFVDQLFSQGMQELGLADSAQSQLINLRMQREKETSDAMNNFMLSLGLMGAFS